MAGIIASIGVSEPTFTIGEVAREFGLTLRTLRFYENRGLISPRRRGSARIYRSSDRTRLALILTGKKLGFTLDQIRQLLAAQPGGQNAASFQLSREKCVEQIRLLEGQKRDIEVALIELRRSYAEPYLPVFSQKDGGDASDLPSVSPA
jgi:DNA-binding transcriptional MerR regulator